MRTTGRAPQAVAAPPLGVKFVLAINLTAPFSLFMLGSGQLPFSGLNPARNATMRRRGEVAARGAQIIWVQLGNGKT